jgi:uncharacterized membrane protein (DUF485 family)
MVDSVRQSVAASAGDTWISEMRGTEFKTLARAKLQAIVPMLIIFVASYMSLSLLAAFGRELLGTKVLGPINLGFVLIAANYLMSWVIAIVYARISARTLDPLVKLVVDKANGGQS